MRTRVVLDTSVLIGDPGCLHSFAGVDVVIPFTVIEELDSLKTRPDDVGRAARTALRTIEEHRVRAGGSLATPFAIGDPAAEGTLQVEINGVQKHLLIEHGLDPHVPDNRIIGAALGQAMHAPTRMVSNDAALRIKAAHLGLEAVEHHPIGRSIATRQAGWITVEADYEQIDLLYRHGTLDRIDVPGSAELHENGFAVVRSGSQSALTRCVDDQLVLLHHGAPEAWGLRSRSKEQRFALELLRDPDVSVVALDGRAGTGKTLLAIAAGLEQVVEQKQYEKLAVYRPLVPVGRADVGFLPGGLDEKLDPWMSAIHDAIVALTDQRSSHDAHHLVDELVGRNQLSLESVTSARVLTEVGVSTPVFTRFSTVAGSRGSADTARDVRGFAVKMYTSEGNWDLVGNNIPVFFIQDGIKFPDLIHAAKPEPDREIPQAQTAHTTFWDFVSLHTEATHHVYRIII